MAYDVTHPLGGFVNVRGPIKVKSDDLTMKDDEGPAGLVIDALQLLACVDRAETFDGAESGYFALDDGREFQVVVTPIEIIDGGPAFPVEDWQYEVANGDTRLGYEEWRAVQLENAYA